LLTRSTKIADVQRILRPQRKINFLPILTGVFWLFVNIPPWSFFGGRSMALLVLGWGTGMSATNSIFPFTYAMAIFTSVFSFIRFRKYLRGTGSAFLSVTTPFAFVGTFEAVYQNLGYFERPSIFHTRGPGELLLASWIILGLASFPFWKLSKKFYILVAADIIGFAIWTLVGYPQIYETGPLSEYAFWLNLVTKLSFGLTFLALLYDGTRQSEVFSRKSRPFSREK
jgi:hypothetical protein